MAAALAILALLLGRILLGAFALPAAAHLEVLERPQMLVQIAEGRAVLRACRCDRTLHPSEVPRHVADAVVAVEDRRFYEHGGIDARGLAAAVVSRFSRGGSTLTQQLAKVAYTGDYRDARRKVAEAVHAWRLERALEKDEILRLYLSAAPFGTVRGQDVRGLRQAARAYFGTEPRDLTRAQAAILAGMLRAPNRFHPADDPERTADRAETAARLMREAGLDAPTRAQIDAALTGRALPVWRDRYVEDAALARVAALGLSDGWYRVTLTLDPVAQYQARNVVSAEIANAGAGVARGALVTVDQDGRIVAMLGGTDYRRSTFNVALDGRRQAASTAKVATYLAAFEEGWRAEDEALDDPAALTHSFRPRNADGRYLGPVPMGRCLAESRNVCTVVVAERVGFERVARMASDLGLMDPGTEGEAIVLGAAETRPVDVAAAFSALAGDGRVRPPQLIAHVLAPYGEAVRLRTPPPGPPVARARALERMRAALRTVVEDGTGHRADVPGLAVAGKTGTSQENRDAWFAGFVRSEETRRSLATAVWVGPREGGRMFGVEGGGLPAAIFARYHRNLRERFLDVLAGVASPAR